MDKNLHQYNLYEDYVFDIKKTNEYRIKSFHNKYVCLIMLLIPICGMLKLDVVIVLLLVSIPVNTIILSALPEKKQNIKSVGTIGFSKVSMIVTVNHENETEKIVLSLDKIQKIYFTRYYKVIWENRKLLYTQRETVDVKYYITICAENYIIKNLVPDNEPYKIYDGTVRNYKSILLKVKHFLRESKANFILREFEVKSHDFEKLMKMEIVIK